MSRLVIQLMLSFVLIVSANLARATIDVTLQMQLGNPSGATADTNNHDHYLIQRPIETLDYNDNKGLPNWASWDLTAGDANSAVTRQDTFAADTNLPASFHQVGPGDYASSGYDRGHLCPSADRNDSTNDNNMTFIMDNMMPQTSDNNSGTWNSFESYCRGQATGANNYEVLIITGPSGFTGAKINTNGYVWIPQFTWKIAVIVPPGSGSATNRITTTNRVIVIKVPNTNGVSSTWQNFITSAAQIEVDTGLTFFTALPPAVASILRNKVDGQTNPPPNIFAFSPTNGSAGANVVITGTNFNSVVAVTFNGASAGFTVNSSNQITATVPTNAGSGLISVTTASGTAISTNSFTVFSSGGGTVYSGILAGWDVSAQTSYGPSPFPATSNAPNLAVVGLTRSSNMKTNAAGALGGWGGISFTNQSAASAIASNVFVTFSLTASNGYKVSYTTINRFDYRRSNTGPTNSLLQFSVGNGAFTDVMTFSNTAAANGATNAPIDLSSYPTLQNVGANTNVTFRIVNYNGVSTGVWYVWDVAGNTQPDLSVIGTVTQVLTTNAPAIAPSFTQFVFTNDQFRFTVTGTAGSNYVVQATTNLASPNWIPIFTNTAPFIFTQLNTPAFSQRFYRSFAQ